MRTSKNSSTNPGRCFFSRSFGKPEGRSPSQSPGSHPHHRVQEAARTVPGSGRISPRLPAFWYGVPPPGLGSSGTQHILWQGHPVRPSLCCWSLQGVSSPGPPAPALWLSLSLCRTDMQENGCGECACVAWGREACVPASFSTPYPKFCLRPSSYLVSIRSPWAPADRSPCSCLGRPEAHDSPREQDGPRRSHGLGRRRGPGVASRRLT